MRAQAIATTAQRRGINLVVYAHGLFLFSYLLQHSFQLHALRHVVHATMFLMAVGSSFLAPSRTRRLSIASVLIIYLGILTGYGQIRGNWVSFWATDVINFGTALGIWAGTRPEVLDRIVRAYGNVLVISLFIAGPMMFFRLEPGSVDQRIAGEGFRFGNIAAFAPSLFLLFFMRGKPGWFRAAVYIALALHVLFGFMTGSRGALLVPLLSGGLYLIFYRKASLNAIAQGGLTSVLITLGAIMIWSPKALLGSLELVERRFGREDQLFDRRAEANYLLNYELSATELLVGRGMGGSHLFIFSEETVDYNIVHFGHLHLVLKGGVLLLTAVILLMAIGIVRGLRATKESERAAVLTLIVFAVSNVGHTQFLGSTLLPFFWVALGHAISAEQVTSTKRGSHE